MYLLFQEVPENNFFSTNISASWKLLGKKKHVPKVDAGGLR